jgi:hypothetical protein
MPLLKENVPRTNKKMKAKEIMVGKE